MFYLKGSSTRAFMGVSDKEWSAGGKEGGREGGGECFPNFSRLLKLRFLEPALLSLYYLSKYCHAGDTITIGAELKTKSCLPVFTPTILMLLFSSKIYYFSFFFFSARSEVSSLEEQRTAGITFDALNFLFSVFSQNNLALEILQIYHYTISKNHLL